MSIRMRLIFFPLKKEEELRKKKIWKWFLQIVEALHHLNSNEDCPIVHRNLHLENVLLDEKDDVKLSLDYSIFYLTNNSTDASFTVGEPIYLAPEVLAMGPSNLFSNIGNWKSLNTYKADIWSLGVVLLQLIGGEVILSDLLNSKSPISHFLSKCGLFQSVENKEGETDDLLSFDDPKNENEIENQNLVKTMQIEMNKWLQSKLGQLGFISQELREMVQQCLILNPNERPDALELLMHPNMEKWKRQKERRTKDWGIKPPLKSLLIDIDHWIDKMNEMESWQDQKLYPPSSSSQVLSMMEKEFGELEEFSKSSFENLGEWYFDTLTQRDSEDFLRKQVKDTLLVRKKEILVKEDDSFVLSLFDWKSSKITHHTILKIDQPGARGYYFQSNRSKIYPTLSSLVQHSSECSSFHFPDRSLLSSTPSSQPNSFIPSSPTLASQQSLFKAKTKEVQRNNVKKHDHPTLEQIYKNWKEVGYASLDKRISRLLLFTNNATLGCSIDRIPIIFTSNNQPSSTAFQWTEMDKDKEFLYSKQIISISSEIFESVAKKWNKSTPSNQHLIQNYDPAFDFMRNYSVIYREKSIHYQRYRASVMKELLQDYPITQLEIIKEARVDIPPIVRGDVWAAILGVPKDTETVFNSYDYISDGPADKQIDLDIPRCHQYNKIISTPHSRKGLKTILKCWVAKHRGHLVYWQGLDSVLAPFLLLHFDNWSKAFCCMDLFVEKYLHNFFTADNMTHLQETLLIFSQMLAYHDPQLAAHLSNIGFYPDLYAVSWFLTLFSHFLHLDKIFNCWDILLVSPFSLIYFMAVAIMKQLRGNIIDFDFNNCILLFSNLPPINIQQAIEESVNMFNNTPPSLCIIKSYLERGNGDHNVKDLTLTLDNLKQESAPRMSIEDFRENTKSVTAVDIRPKEEFDFDHIPDSINFDFKSREGDVSQLEEFKGTHLLIIGSPEPSSKYFGPLFANRLVQSQFPFVSSLHGGYPFQ
eukprot:TRINITY_DN2991_c0_g1_i1.p1 TRINITY_DN2991_c0_g1~~TRINITY_DN2991_c0_g1_i1.p1  ORF type:complete len:983 (-),score=137.22 TRINITY_DN2991_c0_g1_i1:79-3027(-)